MDTNRGYTHACDLWSLSVLTYALLSPKPPFYGTTDSEIFAAIEKCEVTFPLSDPIAKAKDFILQLRVKDERHRPSAVELWSHPWIRDALKNDPGMVKNVRVVVVEDS
jgi:calcium-dependent protein kinase